MASVREYAILYVRGSKTGGVVVGSGNAVVSGGGVHALDGGDHTNLDAYARAFYGGEEGYFAHGAVGATETIDAADGNWHSLTLDANCTLTLAAVTTAKGCSLILELLQDGTGGRTLTLPASVSNKTELEAAQDTTASTTAFLVLITRNGGTTWYGFWAGGSGSAVGALDDLSDVVITSPAVGHKLRHDGTSWVNANLHDEPMMASDGSVATDGLLNPMMHEVAW